MEDDFESQKHFSPSLGSALPRNRSSAFFGSLASPMGTQSTSFEAALRSASTTAEKVDVLVQFADRLGGSARRRSPSALEVARGLSLEDKVEMLIDRIQRQQHTAIQAFGNGDAGENEQDSAAVAGETLQSAPGRSRIDSEFWKGYFNKILLLSAFSFATIIQEYMEALGSPAEWWAVLIIVVFLLHRAVLGLNALGTTLRFVIACNLFVTLLQDVALWIMTNLFREFVTESIDLYEYSAYEAPLAFFVLFFICAALSWVD